MNHFTNNKAFHGNKIIEIRQRVVAQQRDQARHMNLKEFVHHLGIKNQHKIKNLSGQTVHFYLTSEPDSHSRILAITLDGPVLFIHHDLIDQLNDDQLEALVHHEFGHLHYGHTQYDHQAQFEYDADEFAASIVGFKTIIETLERIEKVMGDIKHLQLRIHRLKTLAHEYQDAV